jgi:hypothetical protein
LTIHHHADTCGQIPKSRACSTKLPRYGIPAQLGRCTPVITVIIMICYTFFVPCSSSIHHCRIYCRGSLELLGGPGTSAPARQSGLLPSSHHSCNTFKTIGRFIFDGLRGLRLRCTHVCKCQVLVTLCHPPCMPKGQPAVAK